ncbi:hypothetical protein STEG23_027856 [Scotinomys teguina]
MWSILEKVPWGAEKKQKDGPCFCIHSVNLCLFIVGKIFFNDFVEYVFCAFELVFFSFFYPYYSKGLYHLLKVILNDEFCFLCIENFHFLFKGLYHLHKVILKGLLMLLGMTVQGNDAAALAYLPAAMLPSMMVIYSPFDTVSKSHIKCFIKEELVILFVFSDEHFIVYIYGEPPYPTMALRILRERNLHSARVLNIHDLD